MAGDEVSSIISKDQKCMSYMYKKIKVQYFIDWIFSKKLCQLRKLSLKKNVFKIFAFKYRKIHSAKNERTSLIGDIERYNMHINLHLS